MAINEVVAENRLCKNAAPFTKFVSAMKGSTMFRGENSGIGHRLQRRVPSSSCARGGPLI